MVGCVYGKDRYIEREREVPKQGKRKIEMIKRAGVNVRDSN